MCPRGFSYQKHEREMMETDECVCRVMSDSGILGVATETLGGPCLPFPLNSRIVIENIKSKAQSQCTLRPSTAIKPLN